jgi:hypothetical protein
MTDLYRDAMPDVSSDFVFDDEVLKAALKRIYSEDFNPMTQIEENLFNEFWDKLNEATDKGFGTVTPVDHDYEFYQELRYNNGVFAAFKVHRMQNDMAAKLLDENGELKPFEQWLNDVQPIADHQCRQYFQTEYDTAIKRAHIAADWRQFEQEADVFPNLEWIKSTSITPGEDHKIYWGIIRPMVDTWWNDHKPGDRWGCKCGLRSTDKKPTPLRDIPKETNADDPAPGLNNNPGKDGILFSDTHPYNPPNCAACNLPGKKVLFNNPSNRLVRFFNAGAKGRKDCYHCSRPAELIKTAEKEIVKKKQKLSKTEIAEIKNRTREWVDKNLPEVKIDGTIAKRLIVENESINDKIIVNKQFFNETFAKNIRNKKLSEVMDLATHVKEWLPSASFVENEDGLHHDYQFKVFTTSYNGVNIECKAKVTDGIYIYNMRILK